MANRQSDDSSGIIVLIIVAIVLIWVYIIKPIIDLITWVVNSIVQLVNSIIGWLSSNSTEIIYGIVITVVIVAILYIISEKARKQHEEEQRAKGLIKFTDRFYKEKWGTPQEVELWRNLDYEDAQKEMGLVKFIDKLGNTTWKSPEQIQKLEKEQFEKEQEAKGLVKFVDRFKNEKWGTPQQVKAWEKDDKEAELKESLFYRVVESIEKFEPSRMYKNEFGYHTELQGWLKHEFPEAVVEMQTGASRPDIVIDNVAIEVKGPTDNRALDTLSTKCLKYTNHYPYLIMVLFEPCFSEAHYDEIVEGIEKNFPDNIRVIRKD